MEVELKLRIRREEVASIQDRLRQIHAIRPIRMEQVDIFFAHPSRDLSATDEAFRLRREGDVMSLTYKGPRQPGDVKSRMEHNIIVDADPTAMLEALGFRRAAVLRKHRSAWKVPGAEVAIDEVEGVGTFVEIEAARNVRDPEEVVEGLRESLRLGGHPAIQESYLELALAAEAPSARRIA